MIVAVSGKLPALSLPMERRKCPPPRPAEKSNDLMYIQMFLMNLKMLYNFFFFLVFKRVIFGSYLKESLLKYYLIWTLQIMVLSCEKKFRGGWVIEPQGFCG